MDVSTSVPHENTAMYGVVTAVDGQADPNSRDPTDPDGVCVKTGKQEVSAPRVYPDGFPRPWCRGVLHLLYAIAGYLVLVWMFASGDPRWELELMVFCKTMSMTASAHLHVLHQSSVHRYALANALDFAMLPFNGGGVLAVATPRSMIWLRVLHLTVITLSSCLIARPVYLWTVFTCNGDEKSAAPLNNQRTVITVFFGVWVGVAWPCQAGFSFEWLGSLVFMILGYGCWQAQYYNLPSPPWHGDWWRSHDDFHLLASVADVLVFMYAVPAATAMAAA